MGEKGEDLGILAKYNLKQDKFEDVLEVMVQQFAHTKYELLAQGRIQVGEPTWKHEKLKRIGKLSWNCVFTLPDPKMAKVFPSLVQRIVEMQYRTQETPNARKQLT